MSWILLEGLDRSGKSTIAEYYKQQDYEVVHMSAPKKRYFEPGYSGPSYLEEMVEMYNLYAGQDVVFDRTTYGELVWPEVFNRMPLLNDEDLEYLAQLEYNEDVVRYLLSDDDADAHWKRCVDNKEPINRIQFVQAARLYDKLELERGFERKQLGDFSELAKSNSSVKSSRISTDGKNSSNDGRNSNSPRIDKGSNSQRSVSHKANDLSMEQRLDKANAIRILLEGKIIKKKDSVYGDLEEDIRGFLQKELKGLFGNKAEQDFTEDEVQILKIYAQRIKAKME